MRNIRLFENYEDFLAIQEAISGSGKYVEDIFPGFAYTKDMYSGDTYAYYNGHEIEDSDYHFGDVVYLAPDGKLKSVYWSDYDESMGEKVGLIVVPTSHAADGNARMIAFENATVGARSSQLNVTDGGERVLGATEDYFFVNNGYWYGDMLANGVLCWDISDGARGGVGSDPYLYYINTYLTGSSAGHGQYLSSDWARSLVNPMSPSEGYAYFDLNGGLRSSKAQTKDGNLLGTGTIDTSGKYYEDGVYLGVSPYLSDGTQNPNYVEPDWVFAGGFTPETVTPPYESVKPATRGGDVLLGEGSSLKNPFADWDGYANTYKLQSLGEDAAYAAMQYSTTGTSTGDWYVGAMGEMGYVAARAWAITYIMQMLDGQELFLSYPASNYENPESIFTSTEVNSNGTSHNGDVLFLCRYQNGISPVSVGSSNEGSGEEYPTDIPQFQGSDSTIFTSCLNVPATVRPMAMIKEGEIQHAPFTPRPESSDEIG